MWREMTLYGHVSVSKGRVLLLIVYPLPRVMRMVALETGKYDSTRDVFEDHTHLDLGDFFTMEEMTIAARKYIKKWRRKKALEKCNCGTIELNAEAPK